MSHIEESEGGDKTIKETARLVLGDDWDTQMGQTDTTATGSARRGLFRRSPLTRKIVTFNLIALNILIAGILYLNSSRDSLIQQRAYSMAAETNLLTEVLGARSKSDTEFALIQSDLNIWISGLPLREGSLVVVFDTNGDPIAGELVKGPNAATTNLPDNGKSFTPLTDSLSWIWSKLSRLVAETTTTPLTKEGRMVQLAPYVPSALEGNSEFITFRSPTQATEFAAIAPIKNDNAMIGAVAMFTATGEIDLMVKQERERVLQLLLIGMIVSIALSMVFASTISNPLNDLATAAEMGREKNSKNFSPSRIRIPDLSGRPDEIGRLSAALRGMVSALYDRIDANEQFAADVSHELKNPLASLRSAVGTLRFAKRDDQRGQLLDVIEHDVKRLDRLVTDISNASRLDSELVKERQEAFDLVALVRNLSEHLSKDAEAKGIDFITDLPKTEVTILGLEARLAQVFVNLITNAISFCQDGDAIRVWVRTRDNRALVVVEDTGPGISENALNKIFKRFYSERPENDFGNNSGLGLAISKQIVEAHDGVIWAENIRPTSTDATSTPLGARFVVGFPL